MLITSFHANIFVVLWTQCRQLKCIITLFLNQQFLCGLWVIILIQYIIIYVTQKRWNVKKSFCSYLKTTSNGSSAEKKELLPRVCLAFIITFKDTHDVWIFCSVLPSSFVTWMKLPAYSIYMYSYLHSPVWHVKAKQFGWISKVDILRSRRSTRHSWTLARSVIISQFHLHDVSREQ